MKSNAICHFGFTISTNTLRTWRINFFFVDFFDGNTAAP